MQISQSTCESRMMRMCFALSDALEATPISPPISGFDIPAWNMWPHFVTVKGEWLEFINVKQTLSIYSTFDLANTEQETAHYPHNLQVVTV